ncbi:MAG: DUF3179 domain-containing protein [Rhodospirillales bacterium]|nr:DUF3179 domain-containing protein [Rhodospirillales bacterium]MDP6645766.1 DUF3179 domain-containing protein [Rhodospirillales bacterium]MDP6840340.1 DUF3179 domain-containing protein [Rhodospirillales bacterium]
MDIVKRLVSWRTLIWSAVILFFLWWFLPGLFPASTLVWKATWPKTDFTKTSVDLSEIMSGGPRKDGIPSIDDPEFDPVAEVSLPDTVPVISLNINGDARAYPLGILMSHEIVNDRVGGVPVAVTYCPLCNASIVFDARLNGQELDFGTTGKLRNSDLVMYDRQTESWWQQFLGEAIVGELTGTRLKMIPSRIESFARFKARFPKGKVLKPGGFRGYGSNPYVGYDTSRRPFLFRGDLPDDMPAMTRLVVVGDQAWTLDLLRQKRRIQSGDLVISLEDGRNSALDTRNIAKGREVGNVIVQRRSAAGLKDEVHDITFAFVFKAFRPKGRVHTSWPPGS